MPGVVHHQSVNIIVADLHDGVITAEELNQETTGEEVAVNEKKTFSESELKKKRNGVTTLFGEEDLQMEE